MKCFMDFLQFLVLQDLSHIKLLKKVFMIYLIAISCIVNENLNLVLYMPVSENDINETNLAY